jgi:calmodulin-regulated spectrin-associated protein
MENQWTQKFVEHHEHNNNISLEQYQQSIALMNNDLHDIHEDIQKLAEQQNQIQVQTMQAQQLLQAQQIANILNQQYSSQQNITGMYHPIQQQQQQFGSTPQLSMKPPHHQYINEQGQYINQKIYSRENSRIIDDQYATTPSQYLNQEKQKNIAKYVQDTNHYRDQYEPQQTQFFLHGSVDPQTPPQPPARRTWSQQQQQQQPKQQQPEMSSWTQQAQQTWKTSSPSQKSGSGGGFVLHQNGGRDSQGEVAQRLFPVVHAVHSKPQAAPQSAEEMMAPQSISFIGDEEDDEPDNFQAPPRKSFNQMDDLEASLGKLNITSGSRTYRIPSPTTRNHAGLAANSFQSMESQNEADAENEKGFYISFDNDPQPKRPKPPLRTKRSPKKPEDQQQYEVQETVSKKVYDAQESYKPQVPNERLNYSYERSPSQQQQYQPEQRQQQQQHYQPEQRQQHQQQYQPQQNHYSDGPKESKALLIGNDEKTLDPVREV